jgi:hypothetical protein
MSTFYVTCESLYVVSLRTFSVAQNINSEHCDEYKIISWVGCRWILAFSWRDWVKSHNTLIKYGIFLPRFKPGSSQIKITNFNLQGQSWRSRDRRHKMSSPARTLGRGFNPIKGRNICVYSVLVLGNSLAMGWSPSKESYRLSKINKPK